MPASQGSTNLLPMLVRRISDALLSVPSPEMLADTGSYYQTSGGKLYSSDGTQLIQLIPGAIAANSSNLAAVNSAISKVSAPASVAAFGTNSLLLNSAFENTSARHAFMRQVWERRMAKYKPWLNSQANLGAGVAGTSLIYVDPQARTNGSGTLSSPRNIMPTLASNQTILLKEGSLWNGEINPNALTNWLIGTYDKTTGGRVFDKRRLATVNAQNGNGVHISGAAINNWISGLRCINFTTAFLLGSNASASGGGIEWCYTEIGYYGGLPSIPTCFMSFIDNSVVRFNTNNGVTGDGIWCGQATSFGALNINIFGNDIQNGQLDIDGPDGIQIEFGGTSGAVNVENNWIENTRNRKDLILAQNSNPSGTDSISIHGNFCFGADTILPQIGANPQNGIYSRLPNTKIYGNYVEKSSHCIVCDTNPDGALIYGNLVVVDLLGTLNRAIDCASAVTAPRIYNNTVVGIRAAGTSLIAITSTNKVDCCNNIVIGSFWTRQIQVNATNAGASFNVLSNVYDSRAVGALFDSGAGARQPDLTSLIGSETLVDNWWRPIPTSSLEYSGQPPVEIIEDIYGSLPAGGPNTIGATWPQVNTVNQSDPIPLVLTTVNVTGPWMPVPARQFSVRFSSGAVGGGTLSIVVQGKLLTDADASATTLATGNMAAVTSAQSANIDASAKDLVRAVVSGFSTNITASANILT